MSKASAWGDINTFLLRGLGLNEMPDFFNNTGRFVDGRGGA